VLPHQPEQIRESPNKFGSPLALESSRSGALNLLRLFVLPHQPEQIRASPEQVRESSTC